MRKVILLASFFTTAPILLLISSIFLLYMSFQQKNFQLDNFILGHNPQTIAYAALPSNLNVVNGTIEEGDSRIGKVSDFLDSFDSPLLPYAELMVTKADEYGIDYRLLPAIGAQESADCTKGKSLEWKNCWGYGVYGKHITTFDSYPEAIDTIAHYFANKKARGIDSLDELGTIYNPSNHNDWKGKVSYFMSQL